MNRGLTVHKYIYLFTVLCCLFLPFCILPYEIKQISTPVRALGLISHHFTSVCQIHIKLEDMMTHSLMTLIQNRPKCILDNFKH